MSAPLTLDLRPAVRRDVIACARDVLRYRAAARGYADPAMKAMYRSAARSYAESLRFLRRYLVSLEAAR